jgi:hypothetical protein
MFEQTAPAKAEPKIKINSVEDAPKTGDMKTYKGSDYIFDGTLWVRQDEPQRDFQRFVPVAAPGVIPNSYIALDTVTGTLCKTWNWDVRASPINGQQTCVSLASEGDPGQNKVKVWNEKTGKFEDNTVHFTEGNQAWNIPVYLMEKFKKAHPNAKEDPLGIR